MPDRTPIHIPFGLRAIAAVAALLAFALCAWQVQRHGERNAGRDAALPVAALPVVVENLGVEDGLAWRVVRWRGRYQGVPHLLAGRQQKSGLGYGVAQVFVREDGARLVVDRGWVPAEDVAARVSRLTGGEDEVLVAQLRPASGAGEPLAIAGHGTMIWTAAAWPVIQERLDAPGPLVAVAGGEGGKLTRTEPPLDGFERVPPWDKTSLHYAAQWLAIGCIAAALLFPRLLSRLRQILGASLREGG